MKTRLFSVGMAIAALGTVSAHPGHDHFPMTTSEFALHHLLTGGAITVAAFGALVLGWRLLQRRGDEEAQKAKARKR